MVKWQQEDTGQGTIKSIFPFSGTSGNAYIMGERRFGKRPDPSETEMTGDSRGKVALWEV
jgi:hypothetical protein